MKQKQILLAVGAFAAAGLVVMASRRTGIFGGDAERMSGVRALYGANAGQQAGVDAAIRAEWRSLDSVFATQPDFYV